VLFVTSQVLKARTMPLKPAAWNLKMEVLIAGVCILQYTFHTYVVTMNKTTVCETENTIEFHVKWSSVS